MKNYFLRHYKSSNSGWGKGVETHKFWLMHGDREPGSIDEYDPSNKTFRYCHVAELEEGILFDIQTNKVLSSDSRKREHDFDNHDRRKAFLLQVCEFLNSGKTLKDTKGFFYISEFSFGKEDSERATYTINLIRSDEERSNETRKDSGGFINTSTGDTHLFEMTCFGRKMKTKRKKLMQQICNACNQGLIDF